MNGFIQTVAVNGEIETVPISELPTLERLQGAVGGYIEIVPLYQQHVYEGSSYRAMALCNEEGKMDGLPYNREATRLWHLALTEQQRATRDVLVGPVVIVFGDDEMMDQA